ncbi:bifunctional metallophosphatase/5'-nucleotidase [Leptolyngbya sp. FACHB-17]|uniref:bifunctional metallophosphatase/5'-nucleotidase n=1 Tax=unclassified Leptolyngbya TaxID=2650499 RepID=UPI00168112CA|nr:bifunctional metallophosphatase/5'-nucleotidase [Leptolyngbya sp. FACHB-17]MBD2080993.1 bifunctional metallophosphatase/5'-nucleotidase [Leptolyngbya sp. FACHB-17]
MKNSKRLMFSAKSLLLSFGAVLSVAQVSLAEVINITLLHLNDIYEITPVEGGKRGGMARVATLRKRLLAQNSRTFTLLAGDAFSPSALGTAKVNGRRLAGQQMVATMNAVGFDYATLGNHEFDISKEEFLQRLSESRFKWVSSNVDDETGQAFPKVERSQILTIKGDRGATVRIGLIGLTIDSNPANYVRYRAPIEVAKNQVAALRGKVNAIVALTHLSLAEDQQLAAAVPEIDLILGGHEHENIQQWRLVQRPVRSSRCIDKGTPIFKADANARTVYVHTLKYDTTSRCLTIDSQLQPITAALPDDPKTAKVVQDWQQKGFQAFRDSGFEPNQTVATTTEYLDGLEESVRNRSTNLTELIAKAMLREVGDAELSIFNSGSIRIDDRIPPGTISQYDIIRILPFGGKVLSVEIPGMLLKRVLDQGKANRGAGGYLQTANVQYDEKSGWQIQGKPLDSGRTYKVAINDFLISGKEQNLEFLSLQAAGVKLIAEKRDIRFAVIQEMQNRN